MKYLKALLYPTLLCLMACKKNSSAEDPATGYKIASIKTTTYSTNNSLLPEGFVSSVVIDKQNNVWVGVFAKGLAKFDRENWTVFNTQNSGLASDIVWDIAFDHHNNLWVATDNGLNKFDGSDWTVYNPSNSPLPIKFVSAVMFDKDNIAWIGCGNSETGGLVRFDGTQWVLFTPDNSKLPSRIINKILVDRNNNKWIGTAQWRGEGGIIKIAGESWTLYNKDNSIMGYNHADDLAQDGEGNMWVGITAMVYNKIDTYDGELLKYNGNSWIKYTPHESNAILSNRIVCVRPDRHNNIWFSTYQEGSPRLDNMEVVMFNGKDYFPLSTLDSVFHSSFVKDMEFDSNGILWIGQGDLGLTKVEVTYEQ